MIKRSTAVGVLLAVLALSIVLVGCGGSLPDNGVAKVKDSVITQDQLNTRVKEIQAQLQGRVPTKEQDPKAFADFEKQVLDYMVTLDVIKQNQTALKVQVSDADVQKQIDEIKKMFQGDQAQFDAALKQQNVTLAQLKVNLREQELIKRAIDAVTKNAKVSDAELQKYYDSHKSEFNVGETRKVRHILLAPTKETSTTATATQAQWDAVKAKAVNLEQQLAKGADFATLAKANSDDPGSKAQGGDLGNVTKGMMVPEFDKSAFSLAKGKISEPIKTQYGYHIIQVTDIQPAKQLTFAEAKEQIRSTLLDTKKREVWDAWLKKQKDELDVVYKEGMEPKPTTTTAAGAATTTTAK